MKKHAELDLTGISVIGYEEDYLSTTEKGSIGVSGIVDLVGVENVSWSHAVAFEYPGSKSWLGETEEYRKLTGRTRPPVYRMKIVVEAEELTDAEAEAWWLGRVRHGVDEDDISKAVPFAGGPDSETR